MSDMLNLLFTKMTECFNISYHTEQIGGWQLMAYVAVPKPWAQERNAEVVANAYHTKGFARPQSTWNQLCWLVFWST